MIKHVIRTYCVLLIFAISSAASEWYAIERNEATDSEGPCIFYSAKNSFGAVSTVFFHP